MLSGITFEDKDKTSLVKEQRILLDTNINEIKTVVNNTVTHLNTIDDQFYQLLKKVNDFLKKL